MIGVAILVFLLILLWVIEKCKCCKRNDQMEEDEVEKVKEPFNVFS